ncbi:helicase associated domain-containing protein [Streptomyces sp. NPDC000994]
MNTSRPAVSHPTVPKPRDRTVKLGVWVSNTRARRGKLTAEQLDALRKLGVDWA